MKGYSSESAMKSHRLDSSGRNTQKEMVWSENRGSARHDGVQHDRICFIRNKKVRCMTLNLHALNAADSSSSDCTGLLREPRMDPCLPKA